MDSFVQEVEVKDETKERTARSWALGYFLSAEMVLACVIVCIIIFTEESVLAGITTATLVVVVMSVNLLGILCILWPEERYQKLLLRLKLIR